MKILRKRKRKKRWPPQPGDKYYGLYRPPVDLKYLVAIDPGVVSGVAVFDMSTKRLVHASVVAGKGKAWEDRVYETALLVEDEVRMLPLFPTIERVVCEYPCFIPTPGGIKVAKRGDLVKLAHAVGAIHARVRFAFGRFELVPVRDWKGQTSKEVINSRIERIIPLKERLKAGMSDDRSHDWDAVGIGLWALGRK